jgi:hypothetical protein
MSHIVSNEVTPKCSAHLNQDASKNQDIIQVTKGLQTDKTDVDDLMMSDDYLADIP